MPIELKIRQRAILGKKTKSLRKSGLVPSEIFGRNFENRHVSVSAKDLIKVYKETGEHAVISLSDEETGEKITALISRIEQNPLTRELLAADFRHVRMDEKIHTKIPVIFTGEAPAVKVGHIIIKVLDEIEIETLPGSIPSNFEVNLEKLENIGQSVHIEDLVIPKGVKVLLPDESVIVTVSEKAKEEVVATPSPVSPEEIRQTETAAQPEVNPENK